jgi:hypothetical protein
MDFRPECHPQAGKHFTDLARRWGRLADDLEQSQTEALTTGYSPPWPVGIQDLLTNSPSTGRYRSLRAYALNGKGQVDE